jgi:hypothetical protein
MAYTYKCKKHIQASMDIMSTQIHFVEVEPGKGGSKAKTIAINSTNKEELISLAFSRESHKCKRSCP